MDLSQIEDFSATPISESSLMSFTVDQGVFLISNIGVGLSTQTGIFQMYGMIGNDLKASNLTESTTASLQFGFNLIFD